MTGNELKNIRKEMRLEQTEMAARLKISPTYLSKLESGKVMISDNILLRLNTIFAPSPKTETPKKGLIPYFDADITSLPMELFDNPNEYPHVSLDLPGFRGATIAINVAGDSMHPSVSSGSIVLCKEITDKTLIMFGEIYVVVTNDYRVVKRLKQSKKKGCVLAVSDNHTSHGDGGTKTYSPVDIPVDKILKLYLVTGSIKRIQL